MIPAVCPINPYKIQVARDFEGDTSLKPKILTMNVVAAFTYYPNMRSSYGFGINAEAYVINNEKALFQKIVLNMIKLITG